MAMVIFLTATLYLSIVGLVALAILKHFEMTTGRVILGSRRGALSAFFHHTLGWIEHRAPLLLRRFLNELTAGAKKLLHHATARTILTLEHTLQRVLHLLHYTSEPTRSAGEVSVFLREVAEHKKKLLKRTPARTVKE